jgi:hypothetical protein
MKSRFNASVRGEDCIVIQAIAQLRARSLGNLRTQNGEQNVNLIRLLSGLFNPLGFAG